MFFQAEDGIRYLVRSRGLGDVYKRQLLTDLNKEIYNAANDKKLANMQFDFDIQKKQGQICLLYTSDAADERSSVDLGGRRIIKKKKNERSVHIDLITINIKEI